MISLSFNYYTISLLLGGFTALISGVVVLIHDRKRSENQAWFALTFCTAVWSFGYFAMTASTTQELGNLSNWILHFVAIFIPLFYYLLVLVITNTFNKYRVFFIFFTICAFVFTLFNLSSTFLGSTIPKVGFNFAPVPGPAYVYFFIYFVILVITGIITSWIASTKTNDRVLKLRLYYTIFFTICASVGGGSVFLTTFFENIPPYPLILFSLYPTISGYAILRHQLFNVKVISTQILIFIAWIFVFIRILLSESQREQIINSILLFIIIVLGIILIRTIKREVDQREKIEKLATDLKKANTRLLELDKQKSEFVSFATHQLRAPLTAMKGYASLLLEDELGIIGKEVREAIGRIFDSSKTLANIVDDYLNISRIELGTMKYSFEMINMKDLIENVIGELKPNIEKSGLAFAFSSNPANPTERFMIHADKDKFKQVVANIIDNSIKYTPKGSLEVALSKNTQARKIIFSVRDTGVGIAPEVMPKLFAKFVRAENANKQNIYGTGLGLFIAKEIVTSHKGRIWAESDGEGKGSTFFLEMDMEV